MVRVKHTQETSHAHGRSKLRWERKSNCLSKILKWKRVPGVEPITYYRIRRCFDSARLVGQYCSARPAPFTSSSNYIRMGFYSDVSLGYRGFFCNLQHFILNNRYLIFHAHIGQAAIIRMHVQWALPIKLIVCEVC